MPVCWPSETVTSMPARPEDTVLDCLLKVKRTIDPTLAFRYSCGHGMCGSDAVSINGTPTLLCTATVKAWVKQPSDAQVDEDGFRHTGEDVQPAQTQDADDLGVIELAPLPGFPVQRDLIADIDQMLGQIRKLKPYLQASGELATTADGKINAFEYLQNPQQLAKYELLSNCIACGTCEGSCPVYAGGEAFIGPAALIAASRFINDSRDGQTDARMDAIDSADGIAACQSVRACTRECPRGIDVGEAIRTAAEEAGIPQGSAAQAELLRMLVRMLDASSVIAIGTGSVVETMQLINGLDNAGQLTAVDSSTQGIALIRKLFNRLSDDTETTLRAVNASAGVFLPRLNAENYDLIVVAGDSENYAAAFAQAPRLLKPHAAIVFTDVLAFDSATSAGGVLNPANRDAKSIAMRELLETVESDERFVTALTPTGTGLLVAVKK